MSWDLNRLKLEVYDLLRRVKVIESTNQTSSAENTSVVPSGSLVSTNVQDALEELQLEINNIVSGTSPFYEYTFSSVTSQTFTISDHGLPRITSVILTDFNNEEVSVFYQILGTTIIIDSNINLLNHKLILT